MFTRVWLQDTVERVVWTFMETFFGIFIAAGAFSVNTLKAAGVAAALAVMKCILASRIGNKDSASTAGV